MVVLVDEKKKIIYDSFLIFAIVVKIIFEPDSLCSGILLLVLDIIVIIWTIFGFGTILYMTFGENSKDLKFFLYTSKFDFLVYI